MATVNIDGKDYPNASVVIVTNQTPTPGPPPPSPSPDPAGTVLLPYNNQYATFQMPANGTAYFKATALQSQTPSATAPLTIALVTQEGSPNLDMILRKSLGATLAWPTMADYQGILAKGYPGITTDYGNYFFANISGYTGGETDQIKRVQAQYPNFSIFDTWYIMVVNTSDVPTQFTVYYKCQ